jgi:mRNA interferase YafQ
MYHVFRTKTFVKSYKRIKHSGTLKPQTIENLEEAIKILTNGDKLPASYKDHQLNGEMELKRECHIKGDLLLVYQVKKNDLLLILVEIGTHSYLNL